MTKLVQTLKNCTEKTYLAVIMQFDIFSVLSKTVVNPMTKDCNV